MFRHILQQVTGMVRNLRQRFQKSSGPSKAKKTVIAATKKATKRKKSPGRAVKKAELG
jgi:hypothetical protein